MIKNIKKEVADLQKMIVEFNALEWRNPQRQTMEKTFWTMVEDLDKRAGDGLIGKHLQFSVADNYAHYIVVKAGKQTVQVEHLNIYDGYTFAGVYQGKLMRGVAEQTVKWAKWTL